MDKQIEGDGNGSYKSLKARDLTFKIGAVLKVSKDPRSKTAKVRIAPVLDEESSNSSNKGSKLSTKLNKIVTTPTVDLELYPCEVHTTPATRNNVKGNVLAKKADEGRAKAKTITIPFIDRQVKVNYKGKIDKVQCTADGVELCGKLQQQTSRKGKNFKVSQTGMLR